MKIAKKRRYLFLLLVITVVAIVFFFGTQLSAIISFLTGHEVIVNVKAEEEALTLVHGGQANVTFESRVFTSMLCTPTCTSTFMDISSNEVIDEETFIWKNAKAFEKSYPVEPQRTGAGQDLYRFTLSCHNVASVFCDSTEKPTVQNVLVVVNYDLSEEERGVKQELQWQLEQLKVRLGKLYGRLNALNTTLTAFNLNGTAVIQRLERNTAQFAGLNEEWKTQDFGELERKIGALKASLAETEQKIDALSAEVDEKVKKHNARVDDLQEIKNLLEDMNDGLFVDRALVNETIQEFHTLPNETAALLNVSRMLRQQRDRNVVKNLVELDISKEMLCAAAGKCIKHPSIEARAVGVFHANETCAEIHDFNTMVHNTTDVTANWSEIRTNITTNYLARIQNATIELLQRMVTSLSDLAFEECVVKHIDVGAVNIMRVVTAEAIPVDLGITFDEPQLQCCVFGICKACCANCKEENYPVVFLHGHAVSKDVSYEYSLDVFNDIQHKLEEENYLNAGSISLYTSRDTARWLMNVPVTLRLSYYFDRFQNPDNYVTIQTKSDNIDVYALRMKELIELVQEKTGKDKVTIVAYSMGGLVARRYMHIFGSENVEKLIMIGTPNHGISGDVASYCDVLGEDRECKDMHADSLFMNKLNSGGLPNIPIYNIVGTGCDMDGEQGDGVVLETSARLEGTTNYVVKGECTTLSTLHTDLLEKQEVFEIVSRNI